MTESLAFKAAFADMKLVKTRQVAQLIFEIPLAEFDAAYDVLGGLPNPASERWFAVAAIKLPQAEKETKPNPQVSPPATPRPVPDKPQAGAKREKQSWSELRPSTAAAIRCNEATFRAWLNEERGYRVQNQEDAAEAVREMCEVQSRSELNDSSRALTLWQLIDAAYGAWLAKERVGA